MLNLSSWPNSNVDKYVLGTKILPELSLGNRIHPHFLSNCCVELLVSCSTQRQLCFRGNKMISWLVYTTVL